MALSDLKIRKAEIREKPYKLFDGGGVGMGFSQHSGMVICCDGSEDADRQIANVLWNDPATGVMRHADAGYEDALDCAREKGLNLPRILNP